MIFEPFDQDRGSSIWQYVDLTLDVELELYASAMVDSLPVVGDWTGPQFDADNRPATASAR